MQVHEELAVKEITGHQPGGVGGQGRLAQTSGGRHHGDDRGSGRAALARQGLKPG
jgi:hypothetical protein